MVNITYMRNVRCMHSKTLSEVGMCQVWRRDDENLYRVRNNVTYHISQLTSLNVGKVNYWLTKNISRKVKQCPYMWWRRVILPRKQKSNTGHNNEFFSVRAKSSKTVFIEVSIYHYAKSKQFKKTSASRCDSFFALKKV